MFYSVGLYKMLLPKFSLFSEPILRLDSFPKKKKIWISKLVFKHLNQKFDNRSTHTGIGDQRPLLSMCTFTRCWKLRYVDNFFHKFQRWKRAVLETMSIMQILVSGGLLPPLTSSFVMKKDIIKLRPCSSFLLQKVLSLLC